MIVTILIWVATVLFGAVAFFMGWFAIFGMFNLVWTIKARTIGQERARMRTESTRGTIDGGSMVLLTGLMPVAHATWEDKAGERHVAIGPVISDVRRADDDVTRIDGTTLLVSDDDWHKVRYHHIEAHRLRYMRGSPGIYRQDAPETLVARGKPLPEPPLIYDSDRDWHWHGLPLASLLPYGMEVEVRYDPSCPDDARIMCDGSEDGTFLSVQDIIRAAVSLVYGSLLTVAAITLVCALHSGTTTAWAVAVCTGVPGIILRHLKWKVLFPYDE